MLSKDRDDPTGYFNCYWSSPFAGTTPSAKIGDNVADYQDTMKTYGMWMVPPDLETKVLVIFAEGKMEQAYWIGCVQEPYTNHMTPGIASSTNTNDLGDSGFEGADAGEVESKKTKYGSENAHQSLIRKLLIIVLIVASMKRISYLMI